MIKKPDMYDEVTVNRPFTEGGYILNIVRAEYVPSKDYVKLCLDIAEGPFKNYFAKKEHNGNWDNNAVKYLSLKNSKGAATALKADITSIENSNNFTFDWDEKSLVNKKVGGVFGKVQYQANDGSLKFKIKLKWLRSIDSIVEGKFEIPEPEYLDLSEVGSSDYLESMRAVASFKEKEAEEFYISDDDLPF